MYLGKVLRVVFVLLSVAFITLLERKILGYRQNRVGPNKVRMRGFLQPLLDGGKLFMKEISFSNKSKNIVYILSPMILFISMLIIWMFLPRYYYGTNRKLAILVLLCLIGVSSYSRLLSGWSSNSSYSILGGIRSCSQSIRYEISLSLIIFVWVFLYKTYRLRGLLETLFSSFVLLLMWGTIFLSFVAECNRAPFDFSEGERELVSGFNVEYGRVNFSIIFIAEYGMIIFFSILLSLLISPLVTILLSFFLLNRVLLLRRVYPRFRYDKLIFLNWYKILPVSLIYLLTIFLLIRV